MNEDFRNVLPKIKYRSEQEKQETLFMQTRHILVLTTIKKAGNKKIQLIALK